MKKAILFTGVLFFLLMTMPSHAQKTTKKQESKNKVEKIQNNPVSKVEEKGVSAPDHTHAKVAERSIDSPEWAKSNSKTKIERVPAHLYFNNTAFQIKSNNNGFDLYEKGSSSVYAELVPTPKEGLYRYNSSTKNGAAQFDTKGNLILKYLNSDTGKMEEIKFKSN
ncbi:MAG: hypothetical protein ACTIJ9_10585 [Aequorivita sp.]